MTGLFPPGRQTQVQTSSLLRLQSETVNCKKEPMCKAFLLPIHDVNLIMDNRSGVTLNLEWVLLRLALTCHRE